MSIDPLLQLLRSSGRLPVTELAERLFLPEDEVRARLEAWEKDGTILGFQAVVNQELTGDQKVSAFIEVKISPEKEGGFDRMARRIAKFEQVSSCHLLSGGYDLLLLVEGSDLMEVARFVSEKLSSMEGVISTATHFRLKTYKELGFDFNGEDDPDRLPVSA
jgi:DNA-binding Lrp family transcriptional regulator